MRMIKFTIETGEKVAIPISNIAGIIDEGGRAAITLCQPVGMPLKTDWEFDALVSELERIEEPR